jgi:tRNA threonylcarbamoyladenosine biosynthesis protein TsaE
MNLKINSDKPGSTEKIAASIGQKLKGGEIIELASDLGGGKTTFVRGLTKGAGSTDRVASPSFTISREYKAPNFTIYHFDFYRLKEAGIMQDELAELLNDPKAVIVIEWGNIVHDILSSNRMRISIIAKEINNRELQFEYPELMSYLLEDYVDTNN